MTTWPKENNTDKALKIILFLISPFIAFLYSLRTIKTKSSYVVFFLFCVFFGLSFSVSAGKDEHNRADYTPNVGILTSNHDLYDHNITHKAPVKIGDYCWIGMNSVVLPGVTLGTRTIVAAGSVVTKSFPDGFCVIGGSPAKIIKELDPEKFIPWKDEHEFYGFIPKNEFERSEKFKKLKSKINSI